MKPIQISFMDKVFPRGLFCNVNERKIKDPFLFWKVPRMSFPQQPECGFSKYFADEEQEWNKRVDRLKQHESSWQDYKQNTSQADNRLHWNKKIRFSQKSKGVVMKYVQVVLTSLTTLGNNFA